MTRNEQLTSRFSIGQKVRVTCHPHELKMPKSREVILVPYSEIEGHVWFTGPFSRGRDGVVLRERPAAYIEDENHTMEIIGEADVQMLREWLEWVHSRLEPGVDPNGRTVWLEKIVELETEIRRLESQ